MDTASPRVTSPDQLEAMLAQGRISDEDYSVLRQAFDSTPRKPSEPLEPTSLQSKRWGKSWTNRQIGGVCGGLLMANTLICLMCSLVLYRRFP